MTKKEIYKPVQDIEKLEIACAVAKNRLEAADDLYYRALDACRQALEQLVWARKDFEKRMNSLIGEVTCEEIRDFFEDIDMSEARGG